MSDSIVQQLRTCNTCGIAKPLATSYHRNKSSSEGYLPRCKECRKLADSGYVEAHRDVVRARAKAWRLANPERAKEKKAEWAKANPERRRAHMAKHRNSPQGKAGQARYIANRDPARRQAVSSRYYQKHRDRYATYRRTRRARVRGAEGSHTAEDIQTIGAAQRWRCAVCAIGIKSDYEVDHVVPLALGGSDDKGNLQLLCMRCNRSKGAKHPLDFAKKLGRLL